MTIQEALHNCRISVGDEKSMQDAIAQVLASLDLHCRREYKLEPYGRVDFFCDGVGIELKIKGARAAVRRQLLDYSRHSEITSLVLVTTRRQLMGFSPLLNAKSLSCIYVGNSF